LWATIRNSQGAASRFGSSPGTAAIADYQSFAWATSILPFIEQNALHDAFDFSKGAMDPVNQRGVGTILGVFQCPATDGYPRTVTGYPRDPQYSEVVIAARDYAAILMATPGDDWGAWFGCPTRSLESDEDTWGFFEQHKPAQVAAIEVGLSNTTLLIEKALRPYRCEPAFGIVEPEFTTKEGFGAGWAVAELPSSSAWNPINASNWNAHFSRHPNGAQQVMCDGSVHFLSEGTDLDVVIALDSRAGGEPVDTAKLR
jgi:prepilin-type processing-associated H-X9-DG protein